MSDDYEHIPVEDHYTRSRGQTTAGARADALVEGALTAEFADLVRLDDDAMWAEHDARVARAREADAAKKLADDRRLRAKILRSDEYRVPAMCLDAALAPAIETPAMRIARAFVASPKRILVLGGGVGAGKSTAATWVALEVGGSAPGFLRATELESRGRYDKHAKPGQDLRGWLASRSMLILDDLGAEVLDGNNVFRSLLDGVLDSFYADRKRVVITTNLAAQRQEEGGEPQLTERYGDRIVSRLMEVCLWGDCGNTDLRRGGAR
jgi:DNA replication protein DnaC